MSLFSELKRRNVLRVSIAYLAVSWLLIQIVETLFPVFGLSDELIRLTVIMFAIGFPLVLIFSWLYELTPEGLMLEKDIDRSSSQVHHAGKKLDRVIIIVLALSLGYFAIDKFVLDPARDATREEQVAKQARSDALVESFGDVSIAVLPFVNMSGDANNEYFSDGISEELLNLLAKIPKLRVISRSSSFSFKGKDIDMRDLAEQLEVTHVIEGSVRKDGNDVRITVQLIEALSDSHLWSETYDRELANIFAVQDEISAAVVSELNEKLGLETTAAPRAIATTNLEAHESYLRGRYLVAQRTRDSVEGALAEFEKAVALDPDYALAHAELALTISLANSYLGLSGAEIITRATPHVDRAMALDPTLAEAHAAAFWLAYFRYDLEEGLGHIEKAVQINPNYSEAYVWMSQALADDFGRYKESFDMLEKARQLEPTSMLVAGNYIGGLLERNRLAEAERELEKIESIAPGEFARVRGYRQSIGGKWSNAVFGNLDALQFQPDSRFFLTTLINYLAVVGLEKEALAIFEYPGRSAWALLGISSNYVAGARAVLEEMPDAANNNVGIILAAAGEFTDARPLLEFGWRRNNRYVSTMFSVHHASALIATLRSAGE